MADRRRRRPREDGGEDEEGSTDIARDGAVKTKPSECESEGEGVEGEVLSEYESASEDKEKEDEGSEEDTDSEEETDSDDEDEEEDEEGYEDEDVIIEDDGSWVEEERQSGDGEEQQDDGKNLDDDEDRKNPAYIPRKGAFYEHDTRIHGGGELSQKEKEDEMRPKKKLWKDEDKWLHDRYRDDQQAPKSREELIAVYGYDIRAYDKPPENAPKRGGMGTKRGRRGQRRLGDFVPNTRSKTEVDNRPTYSDMTNENDLRSSHEYRTHEFRTSSDYRNQDNRSQYDSRVKNYRNQTQDYRQQPAESRSHDIRQEPRLQDYRNQDYTKYSQDGVSQDFRNQSDSRHGYRGHADYGNQYQSDYTQRNNVENSRGRGRGRGRARGGRGRYMDTDTSYAHGRTRQSASPREFTNSSYKNTSQDVELASPKVESEIDSSDIRQKSQSQDVVISNKENVQTISVTITNTTTEKKSYSKDRRSKVTGRTRVQENVVNASDPGIGPMAVENLVKKSPEEGPGQGQQGGSKTVDKQLQRLPNPATKADMGQQSRPKRYSSQRQRNAPDVNYSDQMSVEGGTYYNPDAPAYTPPIYRPDQPVAPAAQQSPPRLPPAQPQDAAAYQATILPPPMGFSLPVSTSGLPNAPPRLFAPGPGPAPAVTMTAPSAIIQPQFLRAGVPGVPGVTSVVYGAPPGTYPMPVGFPSPTPPTQQVGMPQQVQAAPAPPAQTGTGQELFRGGTTYYAPELQQPSPNRSPHKRPKAAIPIVDPTQQRRNTKDVSETYDSSRASHPAIGEEAEDTALSPVLEIPAVLPGSDDGQVANEPPKQAELSPPEVSSLSTAEESCASKLETGSYMQSDDIVHSASCTNKNAEVTDACAELLSNVSEAVPPEESLSSISVHNDSKHVDKDSNDKHAKINEETANSESYVIENSSSVSKAIPDVATSEITKEMSDVSLNEKSATVLEAGDYERRRPQVQEFCVRKDLEVADIKPSVTEIATSAVTASGNFCQYGGSKLQIKQQLDVTPGTDGNEAGETPVLVDNAS